MTRTIIAYLVLALGFVLGAYVGLWLMTWWGGLNLIQGLMGQIQLTFFEFLWNFIKVIAGFPVCIFIILVIKTLADGIKGESIGFGNGNI